MSILYLLQAFRDTLRIKELLNVIWIKDKKLYNIIKKGIIKKWYWNNIFLKKEK